MYGYVYLLLCCQREIEHYKSAIMDIEIDGEKKNYQLSVDQRRCLHPEDCLSRKKQRQSDSVAHVKIFNIVMLCNLKQLPEVYEFISILTS